MFKTRDAVQDAMRDMRKSLEKTARCIDQAARSSDPQRNAELMKSLHSAQDSLDAARRALNHAQGVAVLFGTQLLGLLPEAEPVAKVA